MTKRKLLLFNKFAWLCSRSALISRQFVLATNGRDARLRTPKEILLKQPQFESHGKRNLQRISGNSKETFASSRIRDHSVLRIDKWINIFSSFDNWYKHTPWWPHCQLGATAYDVHFINPHLLPSPSMVSHVLYALQFIFYAYFWLAPSLLPCVVQD